MHKGVFRALGAALLLLPLVFAQADDKSYFAARRQAVMKKIEGSAALLEGSPDTRAYVQFRQNNDFYYLTGVETPGAMLLIDATQGKSILFLPPRNRALEIWEGPRLWAGPEAKAVTGIEEVLEVSQFASELERRRNSLKSLYTPLAAVEEAATSRDRAMTFDAALERSMWDGRVSRATAFAANLKKKLADSVDIKDLSPILDSLRRVKDAQEIARVREASRIGALGIMEAMRSTRPGVLEYQIAAAAEFIFKWNGAMGPAYFPIVGSGPNSCALHYHDNRRKMEAGDIVVMDFAPEYQYYGSDITRSFPVSGKFTQEQARIYQIVLDAQRAAIAKVRPGSTFGELGNAVREVLSRFGYAGNMPHGVSHYVGMSTHDVGRSEPFEPGVVLTVEPGIYLPEKNLGVRIEDTVLVTKDGCEILTKDVPKEMPEVEKLMAEKHQIGEQVRMALK
jgi:Xaa-Pro aminopeptidase